jgi:hypothetical protein
VPPLTRKMSLTFMVFSAVSCRRQTVLRRAA